MALATFVDVGNLVCEIVDRAGSVGEVNRNGIGNGSAWTSRETPGTYRPQARTTPKMASAAREQSKAEPWRMTNPFISYSARLRGSIE